MKILRRLLFSLLVGGLFGWAISTRLSIPFAVVSAAVATAFMYGGFAYSDWAERREGRDMQEAFEDDALSG